MSGPVRSTPIAPGDRVSDVLARDESLVEVFVRHAPHFAKLRNRTMRRVMARLVTVEQAARTAHVPVAVLLGELNAALGFAPEAAGDERASGEQTGAPGAESPPPAVSTRAHPPHAPVVEVDVREDLRAGREPFSKIVAAVGALGAGEVLHLRAIFEPAPLFSVLERRGFVHETRRHADDDWSVWFWRPDAETGAGESPALSSEAPPAAPPAATDGDAPLPHTIWLDVRGLEPPEPLVRTLAMLETLPEGHTLVQVNVRVPQFLLPVLAERGFSCAIDESQADRVLVRIWRAP